MQRMSKDQLDAWFAFYKPRDEKLHEAKLAGKELVRWKYQRYVKNYLRCVRGVDESLGTLRKTLEELGLDDNTVVIYSSDQGFYIGDHGWYDKRWMYEESLKMPLIVKWPGITKPGSKVTQMVGVEIPQDMQGVSLVPLLKGEQPADWRKSIYYHYYEYPSVHMVPRHYGIRTERYKLMHFYQFGEEWEMYDLQEDPDELTNIYGAEGRDGLAKDLKAQLAALQKHYGDDSDMSEKPEAWKKEMRSR